MMPLMVKVQALVVADAGFLAQPYENFKIGSGTYTIWAGPLFRYKDKTTETISRDRRLS